MKNFLKGLAILAALAVIYFAYQDLNRRIPVVVPTDSTAVVPVSVDSTKIDSVTVKVENISPLVK